jgi:hypothetical protein
MDPAILADSNFPPMVGASCRVVGKKDVEGQRKRLGLAGKGVHGTGD